MKIAYLFSNYTSIERIFFTFFSMLIYSIRNIVYNFIKFSKLKSNYRFTIKQYQFPANTNLSSTDRNRFSKTIELRLPSDRLAPSMEETSCTSCKTSGRHSFWRLTSLAPPAREHETQDRRAADRTDRGASHHSFIGDSPARSSYPTRISPPCPRWTVGEIRKKEKKKEMKNNRELPTFRNSRALRLDSTPPRAISRLSLGHKSISIGHPRLGPRRKYFRVSTGARQGRSLSGDFIVSQIIKSLVDTGLNASIFRLVKSEHDEFLVKLDQLSIWSRFDAIDRSVLIVQSLKYKRVNRNSDSKYL